MKKGSHIWLDGKLVPWEQATVHVMTHTLHYGSGVFEGVRCYKTEKGPAIFRLFDHVQRFLHSASRFNITVPWEQRVLEQAIIDTVQANDLNDCYIRPLLFFGAESLLLNPLNCSIHCAIIVLPLEKYLGTQGINVTISPFQRLSGRAVPIQSKINGYYVNSIFAHQEAKLRHFDEALLLNDEGTIAEGSVANIFFVINGALVTPPTGTILPGLTRASVITLAASLGIDVQEKTMHVNDIETATEAFFTGTASEITPIASIDGKKLAGHDGPITRTLIECYQNIVHGNNKKFISWLTLIPKGS